MYLFACLSFILLTRVQSGYLFSMLSARLHLLSFLFVSLQEPFGGEYVLNLWLTDNAKGS